MVKIREITQKDVERVKFICKETAPHKENNDEVTGEIIANTYATYYVREEPEVCFGLEADGLLVGYIICSANVKKFKKNFRKTDLKEIKKLNKASAAESWFIPFPYMVFKSKYPAHLHINLLPEYQGKGYGTEMLETLFAALKERGINGVMLLASAENKGAIKFYKRNGFKTLVTAFGGVAMGKKLQ